MKCSNQQEKALINTNPLLALWLGQRERFGESYPEPCLGAGPGVVTYCQEAQDAGERFGHRLVDHRNEPFTSCPGAEAESKLGLKITGIALQIFIRDHHHHSLTPSLDQLTGDGPHTRAREHIPVEHTEFQVVLRLLQLPEIGRAHV